MCPIGDDPLTTGQVDEVQQIGITTSVDSGAGEFTLTYTDNFGMVWNTRPVPWCGGLVCGALAYPDASDTLITTATLTGDQLSTEDDFYNGMKIQFLGDQCGTTTLHPITDYVASTGVVTFTTDAEAVNCGVGTTYRIVDIGTAAAADANGITVNGAGVADAYVGAAITMGADTGCADFASVISAYTSGKVASTADASTCNSDGTYSVVQGASPAIIKKALLDLPNEVIRDVDVSLSSATVSGTTLTMNYQVTFKNPSNNNGRTLTINHGGCNKAGCSPQFYGLLDYGAIGTVTATVTGTTTLTVGGADVCGMLTARGEKVSNNDKKRVIATYVITIADDSGAADTFTVARNGGTATTALAADTTAQTATGDKCGLTFTFNQATGAVTGDSWTVDVGVGGSVAISVSTTGTKEQVECSNRGRCDGETGECKCFAGHTDEDCSIQSSLA